jgi:hypothetical protein
LIYAYRARLLLFLRFGVLAFETGKPHVQRFVTECESCSPRCLLHAEYSRMNAAFMKAETELGKAKPIDNAKGVTTPFLETQRHGLPMFGCI